MCSDVLNVWKPVGEMVGLSHDAMVMWCNVRMQPVIDAYNKLIHLNMSVSTTCPSDEIKMQSKIRRYCHLVALLIHSESCHIPNCSFLLVICTADGCGTDDCECHSCQDCQECTVFLPG